MNAHRKMKFVSLLVATLLLLVCVVRLEYKEDISDFIPLTGKHGTALKAYQSISGAERIFVIVENQDSLAVNPDITVEAVEHFVGNLAETYPHAELLHVVSQVNLDEMTELLSFVYENIPYLLTVEDYSRIDSLLRIPQYIVSSLEENKQNLMFPSGGMMAANITKDPLNLFRPVLERLQNNSPQVNYENYDGHIFTPDMRKAIIIIDTPFGASETEENAVLLRALKNVGDSIMKSTPHIDIQYLGSPVIAVGNANQIKIDSMISISISIVLILLLLLYVFRSKRNILLIALTIVWGWLFALAILSLLNDKVSIIVIGISSVILGIAVNYPLHVITHITHGDNKRNSFRDIVNPLIVGNVTTVGAFLALVPLESVALRDLGLFASFLLIGTIVFSLVFLPHLTKIQITPHHTIINRLGKIELENKRWLVTVIFILTIVLSFFSMRTQFDPNMSNINYMTEQDKANLSYFQSLQMNNKDVTQIYALSSDTNISNALRKSEILHDSLVDLRKDGSIISYRSCADFICSNEEQKIRLELWRKILTEYHDILQEDLRRYSVAAGFTDDSFDEFYNIINVDYQQKPQKAFSPLTDLLYKGYIVNDSLNNEYHVIDIINARTSSVENVQQITDSLQIFNFDLNSINSSIAQTISENFNYIGWACGIIVFLFLWLSLGSIELAVISFIPMAVSWLWILGLMSILNIQFNIVNIILATFIFGQGDDYTIFMTEGATYEYTHRRRIMSGYKNSIIVSALIMFIGIGTLIIAKHPALHALAEVTIVGMFSVVLMAYTIPSFLFKWIIKNGNTYRKRPLRFILIFRCVYSTLVFLLQLSLAYLYGLLLWLLRLDEEKRLRYMHQYVHKLFHFDINHLPYVKFNIIDCNKFDLTTPKMIICNHQSLLDSALFMAMSPKCILVANQQVETNIIIKQMFKLLGHISLSDNFDNDIMQMKKRINQGYSIVIFPEGKRNDSSSINRFHKGAFMLSEKMGIDLLPIMIHGVNDVFPRNSIMLFPGTITVKVFDVMCLNNKTYGENYSERTKYVRHFYANEYIKLKRFVENEDYFKELVYDRYRYKSNNILKSVKYNLKNIKFCDFENEKCIYIEDNNYGEKALLLALMYPEKNIYVTMNDEEKANIFKHSANELTTNTFIQISTNKI